jgi:rhodanese-related sulfurtransferase
MTPSTVTPSTSNDWELFAAIRKEELADDLRAGRVQIVNVLPSPGAKVIPSTRHIPLDELPARLGELDRTWSVVVYCQNRDCPMSRDAARLLAKQGFHVRPYEGGIDEWIAAGLPTEPPAGAKKAEPSGQKSEDAVDDAPSSRSHAARGKKRSRGRPTA